MLLVDRDDLLYFLFFSLAEEWIGWIDWMGGWDEWMSGMG